jgi:hypothetical protein
MLRGHVSYPEQNGAGVYEAHGSRRLVAGIVWSRSSTASRPSTRPVPADVPVPAGIGDLRRVRSGGGCRTTEGQPADRRAQQWPCCCGFGGWWAALPAYTPYRRPPDHSPQIIVEPRRVRPPQDEATASLQTSVTCSYSPRLRRARSQREAGTLPEMQHRSPKPSLPCPWSGQQPLAPWGNSFTSARRVS